MGGDKDREKQEGEGENGNDLVGVDMAANEATLLGDKVDDEEDYAVARLQKCQSPTSNGLKPNLFSIFFLT